MHANLQLLLKAFALAILLHTVDASGHASNTAIDAVPTTTTGSYPGTSIIWVQEVVAPTNYSHNEMGTPTLPTSEPVVTFRDDSPIFGAHTNVRNVTDNETVTFAHDVPMSLQVPTSHHDTSGDVFSKALLIYAASSLVGMLACYTCMKCCGHLSSTASWEIVDSGGGQKIFKRIKTVASQIPSYTLLGDENLLMAAHLAGQDELMPAVDEEAVATRPQKNTDPRRLQVDPEEDSRPKQSYIQSLGIADAWARTLAAVSPRSES